MSNRDTIYLVDGSAYVFRAFWAIRNMSNSKGFPTNALYGFVNMIRKLLEAENPEYIAVTFDPFGDPMPNFRTELYPEYKANRDDTPEDLVPQLPRFREIVEALNIPFLEVSGVEADDVIATMCRKGRAAGLDVCIVSADKDLLQLLTDDHVRMIDTMRDKTFTPVDAEERFGVPPEKVKYVMALSGDSSDNIPGVPGIGEKTGGKLIAEFGDLETLLANIDKVSGKKRKENLETYADQARLSLDLVTLRDDCDIDFDLDALRLSAPDVGKLEELFKELEFGRPLRDIEAWMKRRGWLEGQTARPPTVEKVEPTEQGDFAQAEKSYRIITKLDELEAFVAACRAAPLVALDLETTSLNPLDAVIVGWALSHTENDAIYVPTEHRYIGAPTQLSNEVVAATLKPLLESDERKIVCQNAKYETMVLHRYGIELRALLWDTMLMSYLLDPGRLSQGLDAMAKDFLGHEMTRYKNVAGSRGKAVDFDLVDVETACDYAAEDADVTLALCRVMEPVMQKAELAAIHHDIERPLIGVLARMEEAGIRVDRDICRELSREFEKELTQLQRDIDEIAGRPLNPNSPTQLREVLFDDLGLPVKKHTKSGPSTDQSVLEQLAELHELPDMVLEYRSFSKLKGTYVDALPALIREDTGRVHTDFNQAVTATGRLSSSNPNLQNIPIRSARGRQIRRAFVPADGWKLIVADYSQIELRIMAHMSGDPKLLHAYQNGEDIHRLTASEVFEVALDEVSPEQRSAGKTINFGVMYGMGANRLARDLKISRSDAKRYIANYFRRYAGVTDFFSDLRRESRAKGYAETLFGRRRMMDELYEGTRAQRSFAERVAVNMPIQGTAADIIKLAMISLDREIRDRDLPMRLLLQVHDELVLEAPPEFAEEGARLVERVMEGVADLEVPLEVEAGIGDNWYEAK